PSPHPLSSTPLPPPARAHSPDTQSIAEATRRARAQKKNSEKPTKVITDENLEVKKGDVQSAAADQLRIPGTPQTPAQSAPGAANAPAESSKTSSEEDARKERAAVKEKIKEALSDLD